MYYEPVSFWNPICKNISNIFALLVVLLVISTYIIRDMASGDLDVLGGPKNHFKDEIAKFLIRTICSITDIDRR